MAKDPKLTGKGGAGRGQGRKPKGTGLRVVKTLRLSPEAWARLQAEQQPGESLGDTASRLLTN